MYVHDLFDLFEFDLFNSFHPLTQVLIISGPRGQWEMSYVLSTGQTLKHCSPQRHNWSVTPS